MTTGIVGWIIVLWTWSHPKTDWRAPRQIGKSFIVFYAQSSLRIPPNMHGWQGHSKNDFLYLSRSLRVQTIGLCYAPSMFQVTTNELPKPFLRKFSWFSSMISLSTVHHYPRIFTIWKHFSLHFRRDTFTCTILSVYFLGTDYIVLAI